MTTKERTALVESLTRLCADIAAIACALEGDGPPRDSPAPEPEKAAANAEQELPAEEPAPEPEKVYTFEEARGILAEKARNGFRAEVKGLLAKRHVEQLSDITDPKELAALVKEAEGIGIG